MASGATCVQRLDGSRDSAIHTKYRTSLRSSSMREPRYPLPRVVKTRSRAGPPHAPSLHKQLGARRYPKALFLGAHRAGYLFGAAPSNATHCWGATVGPRGGGGRRQVPPPSAPCESVDEFTIVRAGLDNDPSAGSPTETLLRLLLPLNDKVQWTSRDVAGGEPPPSPRSEHFTGPFNR